MNVYFRPIGSSTVYFGEVVLAASGQGGTTCGGVAKSRYFSSANVYFKPIGTSSVFFGEFVSRTLAVGGGLAGGAATTRQVYAYSSVGGLLAGGQAITAQANNASVTGGLLSGGQAVTAQASIASVAGGVFLGGQAITTQANNASVAGGVLSGGQAITAQANNASVTGGLLSGGQAVTAQASIASVAGGVFLGGQAITGQANNASVAGGVLSGGQAVTLQVYTASAGGGLIAGSDAATKELKISGHYISNGGLHFGGEAICRIFLLSVGRGGVSVGRNAEYWTLKYYKPKGGLRAGGTSKNRVFTDIANNQQTKIKDLHAYLLLRVPKLSRNPEQLLMFVENGKIEFHSGANYSHTYIMPLRVVITDWRGTLDELTLPILEWLSVREPGFNPDTVLSFDSQIIDHETLDISYTLNITERVIVTFDGTTRTVQHILPEPPSTMGDPLEIHVNGPAGGFVLSE
ncbi:tail completion protein R (GpR) [Alteromonadaceae bacterium 2753L.S.0a.02]|nr:tail completion protein R (GpR) [Alteromonadaceae bacterium 2753L.S.0a.02]